MDFTHVSFFTDSSLLAIIFSLFQILCKFIGQTVYMTKSSRFFLYPVYILRKFIRILPRVVGASPITTPIFPCLHPLLLNLSKIMLFDAALVFFLLSVFFISTLFSYALPFSISVILHFFGKISQCLVYLTNSAAPLKFYKTFNLAYVN